MSIVAVDRKAWRALFAAQLGWMLDAMDFLLFTFALVSIKKISGSPIRRPAFPSSSP